MADMKDHSYLFSLRGLHEMQADRERGERVRKLAEQQRLADLAKEERDRRERLELERERNALLERQRLETARAAATAAAQMKERLESEERRSREVREARYRHEQVLSQHNRDRRIVRLQGALVGVCFLLAGSIGAGVFAVDAERRTSEQRISERDGRIAAADVDIGEARSRLERSESERRRMQLEVERLEREATRTAPDSTELTRPPARPPRKPKRSSSRDGRAVAPTAQPCTGDENDPLNPCLPR